MTKSTAALLLTAAFCLPSAATPVAPRTIRTVREVVAALSNPSDTNCSFSLEGTLRSYYPTEGHGWICCVGDMTNNVEMIGNMQSFGTDPAHGSLPGLGDTVRVSGAILSANGKSVAHHAQIILIANGRSDSIPELTPGELNEPNNLNRLVRVRGIVRDAARDDSDPNFIHLTLANATDQAQAMVIQPTFLPADFIDLIGCEVVASGICSANTRGLRRHIGRLLSVSGLENVKVVSTRGTFDNAPSIGNLADALPKTVFGSGLHQAEGTVIACWDDNAFLLRTDNQEVIRIQLQESRPPAVETRVKALGLPVTDFYHINLIHADWQPSDLPPLPPEPPHDTTPQKLLQNEHGLPQLMIPHHGEAIRLVGVVRYLADRATPHRTIQIESSGHLVSIKASAADHRLDKLSLGSTVSVSGICVMTADDWHIDSTFRPPSGFFLVLRTPDDVEILKHPSWWTPQRLIFALAIVFSALLGILLWNIMLNHRAKVKGIELASEQLAHVSSELRVRERTRLAVELHDALSQTLTGVSMQIDTAVGFTEGKMPVVTKCLNLASRTIDACRMELRNTLWDLRSAALDEPSMDGAIRKTLCQNLVGIKLSVRFSVPRESFSDNTTHTILKIIRELASNAIRHGKATVIFIAGAIDGRRLRFSVRDNGCGFDPELAPGISEGHFGLQGISERLERLDGEMTIDSSGGKGTKVSISIPILHLGE